MGIAFITAKAEKFQHTRDAAFEEQHASANLFSALPDTTNELFRCKGTADVIPEIGTVVLLYNTQAEIRVFDLNNHVGTVMSPDSATLKEKMDAAGKGAVAATVMEARPMSKIFIVHLQEALP